MLEHLKKICNVAKEVLSLSLGVRVHLLSWHSICLCFSVALAFRSPKKPKKYIHIILGLRCCFDDLIMFCLLPNICIDNTFYCWRIFGNLRLCNIRMETYQWNSVMENLAQHNELKHLFNREQRTTQPEGCSMNGAKASL